MSRHRPILMVSTCGTSLLTNGADPDTVKLLRASANWQQQEFSPEQQQKVDERIHDVKNRLQQSSKSVIRAMSAELNGLLGYFDSQLEGNGQDQHYLIHTDTFQGCQVANILEAYMKSHEINVSKQTFSTLRTDTIEHFQAGINELIKWCEDTLPGYSQSQYQIVFNLTGGFKSIQGWMQTLGMFYADEIVYIFESGRELLRIPRIPVAINDGVRMVVEQHLDLFRRLAAPHAVCDASEVENIPEVFFFRLNHEAELSPWGKLVWERSRNAIYGEKLHDPPTDCIRYTDKFKKAAASLQSDRRVILNERIDDLTAFRNTGTNPKRLDFKQLNGNPCPPSTHECDAWADQSAWRIFAHFDGERLVLDNLGEGLH